MSTSPASSLPARQQEAYADVFDQLLHCDRMLPAKELAGLLAISPKPIYSYVERNMIPYYRIEANIRFRASDVAEWLRDHSQSRFEFSARVNGALNRSAAYKWR